MGLPVDMASENPKQPEMFQDIRTAVEQVDHAETGEIVEEPQVVDNIGLY